MQILSKSSYCSGVQCLKILWLKTHCPQEAQVSESTQKAFDSGHTVGDYAKKYFGSFEEIQMNFDNFSESFKVALEDTKNHINKRTPTICEAAFSYKNTLCFADIVRVNADKSLEIIEVKQTTGVKPQHFDDMAFQYYVIKNCGYNISKVSLMHIDSGYIRQGDIEPQKLFKIEDCTQETLDRQKDISAKIEEMIHYSSQKQEPQMEVGKQCTAPYTCAYWEHCHQAENAETEEDNQTEAEINIINFNKAAIRDFLSKVRYPLYYFDFETTCMEAIPPVDGASPYHPMPFQYSWHIQKSENEDIDNLEHREFLANEFSNQSVRALAEQLCRDIPQDAAVMAYNITFEKGVIKRLAEMFPDLSGHLLAIERNFIDLMSPFHSKHLQTKEMQDSYSIKYVLPALIPELAYSDLEVQNGGMAYETFKSFPHLSSEEQTAQRNALLAYCKMDTIAMAKILRKIEAML